MANRLNVGSDVQDKLKKDTVRQLESLFEEVRDERLPHVQVHGDPTPHNIFWDIRSGEVNLIDFNLHPSVAAEDLVVFEAGIELMTARLPFGRPSQSEAIVDRFRLSYTTGGVHETVPERTVKILKLAYYVHLLNKYFRHMTPNTSRERVTQHIDRRILKRKIRNLVSLL
jgi:tRNA A-37 threonylcarbamoyl transferase component Bud32